MDKRILIVSHGHPEIYPGGGEIAAYNLHRKINSQPGWKSVFLARHEDADRMHGGTAFSGIGDGSEILMYSKIPDWFRFTQPDKARVWRDFREVLELYQPDIVHFHHYVHLGLELIREVRNYNPEIRIILTLHEFFALCHNHGQMIKAGSKELCRRASPQDCHRCFPTYTPQDFFFRKQFIQSFFALVDEFVSPSRFLAERYVDWGVDRHKIRVIENLLEDRDGAATLPERTGSTRVRLGFFGQINSFKGVDILLRSLLSLPEEVRDRLHLSINGSGLENQPDKLRNMINGMVKALDDCVTLAGPYKPEELPGLMGGCDWIVIPSIWWENSPVVILEAKKFGVPVICSDIGGMAEKVEHGVSGRHFMSRRVESLANEITWVVDNADQRDEYAQRIFDQFDIDAAISAHMSLYRDMTTGDAGSGDRKSAGTEPETPGISGRRIA